MAKKSHSSAPKQPPQIYINGRFVLATFLRICRTDEIMEADARTLFSTLQKRGEIIEMGGIGINDEIKSFTYKNQQ